MFDSKKSLTTQRFSVEEINDHIRKIFSNRLFETSDILKRFLSFIVRETLEGRSNQLKEYTIGVGVLNKPAGFKPQQDAIVRIHAGRLRRALHHYYKQEGQSETIRIFIPKGSYVPFFTDKTSENYDEPRIDTTDIDTAAAPLKPIVVAVIPFMYFEKRKSEISFAEGLAAQLSTELGQLKDVVVIAYYTMQRIEKKIMAIKKDIPAIDVQYVFTGEIQKQDHRYRINIQLIDTKTNEQVWSRVFERRLTPVDMFEIQDGVIGQIILEFKEFCKSLRQTLTASPEKSMRWTKLTLINNPGITMNKTIKTSISA